MLELSECQVYRPTFALHIEDERVNEYCLRAYRNEVMYSGR